MQVHEKIRFLRQLNKLSQQDMADKLGMCLNGYAKIEHGGTNIQLERLEQIAKIFDVDLLELLSLGEKNTVYLVGDNNQPVIIQHIWHNSLHDLTCVRDDEVKKYHHLLEQKERELKLKEQEIARLKETIAHIKKE
jgi:transcriptional regulator with XRE-family HTH domain